MIRFVPDNWTEAALRYFAMAAPNANVYIEIPAADLRFALVALLALLLVAVWPRRLAAARPVVALLALVLVATVPWLATSGNGRYWIAILICAGPLLIGLLALLPATRAFKFFLASALLACQTYVVLENPPWDSWTMTVWQQAPYLHIEVPPSSAAQPPVTYVTLSSNSFSAMAPQFPASVRWVNIASGLATVHDIKARETMLATAQRLELITPSIDGEVTALGQPSPGFRKALDALMASNRLSLKEEPCTFLKSQGLRAMATKKRELSPEIESQIGFWLCPLQRSATVGAEVATARPARTEAAFERVEQMCPRFFPHRPQSVRINAGMLRQYPHSDMKVYVLDNGDVKYKFWRALNAVRVGTVDEVLNGTATIDCDQIRGRSGLPWQREI
jgi:hypothetical protein